MKTEVKRTMPAHSAASLSKSDEYDKRSGEAINRGTKHGVGKAQPVGTKKHEAR